MWFLRLLYKAFTTTPKTIVPRVPALYFSPLKIQNAKLFKELHCKPYEVERKCKLGGFKKVFSFFFFDIPEVQFGFQDPASPTMEGIIDLHHDICFFLLIVMVFVSWLLLRSYQDSIAESYSNIEFLSQLNHRLFIDAHWAAVRLELSARGDLKLRKCLKKTVNNDFTKLKSRYYDVPTLESPVLEVL